MTVRYCALELIRSSDGRNLDLKKADIFSFGAAVYELCLSRELGEAQTYDFMLTINTIYGVCVKE